MGTLLSVCSFNMIDSPKGLNKISFSKAGVKPPPPSVPQLVFYECPTNEVEVPHIQERRSAYGGDGGRVFGGGHTPSPSTTFDRTIKSNEVVLETRDDDQLHRLRRRDPLRSIIDEPNNNLKGEVRDWLTSSVSTYEPVTESSSKIRLS